MLYFRLEIVSERRGPVYRRDMAPREMLMGLTDEVLTDLVRRRMVLNGQRVAFSIAPGFESPASTDPVEITGAAFPSGLFALSAGSELRPDTPLTHIAVQVHVTETGKTFARPCSLTGLRYVAEPFGKMLSETGVLAWDEPWKAAFYLHDDDDGTLGREYLLPTEDDEEFVSLLDDEDVPEEDFPHRHISDWTVRRRIEQNSPIHRPVHDPSAPIITIVIDEQTLDEVSNVARSGAQVEQGGVLVGDIFRSDDGYIVEISGQIFAEAAEASLTHLRYSVEDWLNQDKVMKERYSGKKIVGWYHTHLIKMAYSLLGDSRPFKDSELFFSRDDCFLHEKFFGRPYHVAMVLDPNGACALFAWHGNKIVAADDYWVVSRGAS